MELKKEFLDNYDALMELWENKEKSKGYTLNILKIMPITNHDLAKIMNETAIGRKEKGYLVVYANGVSEWRNAEIIEKLLQNVN